MNFIAFPPNTNIPMIPNVYNNEINNNYTNNNYNNNIYNNNIYANNTYVGPNNYNQQTLFQPTPKLNMIKQNSNINLTNRPQLPNNNNLIYPNVTNVNTFNIGNIAPMPINNNNINNMGIPMMNPYPNNFQYGNCWNGPCYPYINNMNMTPMQPMPSMQPPFK